MGNPKGPICRVVSEDEDLKRYQDNLTGIMIYYQTSRCYCFMRGKKA